MKGSGMGCRHCENCENRFLAPQHFISCKLTFGLTGSNPIVALMVLAVGVNHTIPHCISLRYIA